MVDLSLDKFSKTRKWEFFGFFIPITPIHWVRIEKAGNTQLLGITPGDKWELHANDAVSLRVKRYTWRGKKYSDVPIAGASTLANTEDSWDTIMPNPVGFHGNRHKIAKKRVDQPASMPVRTHEGRSIEGYDGMHAYRSLTTEWRRGDEPPMLKLRIEVTLDPKNIHSSQDLNGETYFTSEVYTPGDVISSVSAAEMFFERPCLNDSCGDTEEYADSYSPYWDVRLAKNSSAARLAAYALHGDTLSEDNRLPVSTASSLPGFNTTRATPVDDYNSQVKGVDQALANMEAHLASLEEDSQEFREYQSQLDNIKNNINREVGSIVDDFTANAIDESDLIQAIAKAADFDFDVDEFELLQGAVAGVYQDMVDIRDLADLEGQFEDLFDEAIGDVEAKIRAALEEKLRTAVATIMANLVGGAIENLTGVEAPQGMLEDLTNRTTEEILSTRITDADETAIDIDLRDECEVYRVIHDAELKVQDMQLRLETVNEQIALDFHDKLVEVTTDIESQINAIDALITERRALLLDPDPYLVFGDRDYDELGDYNTAVRNSIRDLATSKSALYGERVDILTDQLMIISDRHTATILEFNDYRLEERFARQAVEDTLGDIYDLTLTEDGETVSDNLFFAEDENELDSDREQNFAPPPEGC